MQKKMKVLLVEDDESDIYLVQEILAQYALNSGLSPFDLSHVQSLGDALEKLQREEMDVVLLDLTLPDSHGLDSLKSIRSKFPQIPIVILSGVNDEGLSLEAVRNGAQDYLVKGQVEAMRLSRMMRYAVERKNSEVAIQSMVHDLEQQVAEKTQALQTEVDHLKKTEQMLIEKCDFLTSIIDSLGDAVAVLDLNGKIAVANDGMERLIGSESVGRAFDIWSNAIRCYERDQRTPSPLQDHPFVRAARGERTPAHPTFIRTAQKPEGLDAIVRTTPLKDSDGTLKGGIVILRTDGSVSS